MISRIDGVYISFAIFLSSYIGVKWAVHKTLSAQRQVPPPYDLDELCPRKDIHGLPSLQNPSKSTKILYPDIHARTQCSKWTLENSNLRIVWPQFSLIVYIKQFASLLKLLG